MEPSGIILGVVIGVSSSLLAMTIWLVASKRRQKALQRKIEELDYEERFLERISRGNVELLRSSFKILCFSFGLTACAAAAILMVEALRLHPLLVYNVRILGAATIGAAGALCISHFRSLAKLNDLPKAREHIRKQREQLESKVKGQA